MNTKLPICLVLLAIFAASLGCQEDTIHTYDAPKDPTPTADSHNHDHDHDHTPAPTPKAPPQISWTLPAGWSQQSGSGMRFATLNIDNANPPLEISVTPLGMKASQTLGNVQRWAGQIGMKPITELQLPDLVTTINVHGLSVDLINLKSSAIDDKPALQTLAAILRNNPTVWFFKLTGDSDQITPHQKAFEDLIKSIRFTTPEPVAPVVKPTAPKGNKLVFQAPASWQKDPAPNTMRVASFIIGDDTDGAGTGEVAVTRFPGSFGGLLANVNRWRGQVNLPTIDTLDKQEVSSAKVGGMEALTMDLIEPDEEPEEAKRMIVIILPHNNMTWFFKMTGSSELLEKQKPAFAAFIHSVRFTADPGDPGNNPGPDPENNPGSDPGGDS